jgi:hypothetical protein
MPITLTIVLRSGTAAGVEMASVDEALAAIANLRTQYAQALRGPLGSDPFTELVDAETTLGFDVREMVGYTIGGKVALRRAEPAAEESAGEPQPLRAAPRRKGGAAKKKGSVGRKSPR